MRQDLESRYQEFGRNNLAILILGMILSPNHLDRVPPFLHAPTSPVMNSSSNNPRPLPPNVGHNLQLVANATPQVPVAHLYLALGFKNKTFSFVPIVSSCWLIHAILLIFANAHMPLPAPSSLSLLSVQVADPSLSPYPHLNLCANYQAVHVQADITSLCLSVVYAPKPVPISCLCAQWSKGEFSALWNRASNHHSPGPMRLTSNHKSSSVQTAVSLAREGLLSKACQTLTSSGLAPDNNTTWNLLVSKHPKGTPPTPPPAPLLAAPYLPPDFNIMAVLHSFPKDTACGPSGLRIQHLIEAAEVPLQFRSRSVLYFGRAAPMVSMVLWATSHFVALFGYYFFRNRCTSRPVARVLAIIQESGPPLGLNINIAKCELFSSRDLSSFPEEMRRSNVPHFEILGAPIGDLVFCAKFVAQKQSEASKFLKELETVGSIDPQVALLLLRQCGSFCRHRA
eukprot:Em0001g244a